MMLRPPVSTTADTLFPYPPLFRSVAQVAQPPERDEQPVIVALVQTDRRLVQHIKHARQARPDLAREPDALAFAARQRARRALPVEIIQADIEIGRAHVRTPVTNAQLVCRLTLEKKNTKYYTK